MHAVIADKREELAELCRRYGVARLEVFGLVDALREALGRPVDVVENHEFRNPYLRASINESREVVYAS